MDFHCGCPGGLSPKPSCLLSFAVDEPLSASREAENSNDIGHQEGHLLQTHDKQVMTSCEVKTVFLHI